MNEPYLTSILDYTEQCCQLLLCSSCKTLPLQIYTRHGQESILCLSCAERLFATGKASQLSMFQLNVKLNKVLALLNRTFQTLYELNSSTNGNEHLDEKKQAIKEGVVTCFNLLRSLARENNKNESKKRIFIKKKTLNILEQESDDEENDKENRSDTTSFSDDSLRRKTARGFNPTKRTASLKQNESESPPKRSKFDDDIDKPLSIISPALSKKKTIGIRTTKTDDGEEKKTTSICLTKKVSSSNDETKVIPDTQENSTYKSKSSIDIRNNKGESLLHQAVKKGDLDRVKKLIEDGHSVNTVDHNSWTPLHEACTSGNLSLVEVLISNKANVNVQGGEQRLTVLHEALIDENPNENLIKLLLENGADPNSKNQNGQTAFDLAVASKNEKILSIFQSNLSRKTSSNEVPTAPPNRRRGRTTSSSFVIFLTGFEKNRKESLMKSIQTIFGKKSVSTSRNVENNVTHIVACGETERIAFRTINYLRAIVLGKWVVDEKWIDSCIQQKQWIDEKDFEILGSQLEPQSNGCQASRIRHEKNELSIFDRCQFYLYGQFHTYKKEDLADLIKITGAPLLKREPKLHRIDSDSDVNNSHSTSTVYIIYESTIPDVLLDTNRLKHIKLLDFLACIDYYETQGRLDQ